MCQILECHSWLCQILRVNFLDVADFEQQKGVCGRFWVGYFCVFHWKCKDVASFQHETFGWGRFSTCEIIMYGRLLTLNFWMWHMFSMKILDMAEFLWKISEYARFLLWNFWHIFKIKFLVVPYLLPKFSGCTRFSGGKEYIWHFLKRGMYRCDKFFYGKYQDLADF